jgi:hypothetical protein
MHTCKYCLLHNTCLYTTEIVSELFLAANTPSICLLHTYIHTYTQNIHTYIQKEEGEKHSGIVGPVLPGSIGIPGMFVNGVTDTESIKIKVVQNVTIVDDDDLWKLRSPDLGHPSINLMWDHGLWRLMWGHGLWRLMWGHGLWRLMWGHGLWRLMWSHGLWCLMWGHGLSSSGCLAHVFVRLR